MQGTNNKMKMPWWFWFAALLGSLSFIPLLIAGSKTKNNLWIGWGVVQGIWLFFGPAHGPIFDLEMLFWIASAIYVFTVVRKGYLLHMETVGDNTDLQPLTQNPNQINNNMKVWDCLSCGANNKNTTGTCEYCGVSTQ